MDTTERAEIYYRTSDRVDWTLLGTITATKVVDNVNKRVPDTGIPVREQRYQFVKFDSENAPLPEFNEIQWKFKLFNGMSIIGAWMEYSYITRNTLK